MMEHIIYLGNKDVNEHMGKNIKEMQNVEIVIAPSLLTEGKVYQKAQQ